jgi:hypothetical protein
MSVTYVSAELRRLVIARADNLCEYCLISEDATWFGCEVDHIISEKHGGPTTAENLALACATCNAAKGSDIGSIDWTSGQFVRFFHPRSDLWHHHFRLEGFRIAPLTPIGTVTANILELNRWERLLEREVLIAAGQYPSKAALQRMNSDTRDSSDQL